MTIRFHDTDTAFKTGPHASLSVQQLVTNHQDDVKYLKQLTEGDTEGESKGTILKPRDFFWDSFILYLVPVILGLSAVDALTTVVVE